MQPPYAFTDNLLDKIPEIPEDSIVSRTIYNDDQMKVTLFGFAAGQELSEHTSSMPAVIHILQGHARLVLGVDTMEAQAGSWVHMQPNLAHALSAKTPVIMLLILLKAVHHNQSSS